MSTFISIFYFIDNSTAYIFPFIPLIIIFILALNQFFDDMSSGDEEDTTKYEKQRIFYHSESSYVFFWFMTMIVAAIPLAFLNAKYEAYIYKVLEKNNISIIGTVSMTFTAMVFAMAFVLILREKNFYIIFSLSDVLEQYNFGFWIRSLFISCIIVSLAVLSLLDGEIVSYFDIIRFMVLEYAFIINILSLLLTFRVILLIMFSSINNELVLLNKLYQLLGMSNIDTSHMKEKWDDKTAITINFDYLYNQYISMCDKVHIKKIESIFYSSWTDNEKDKKRVQTDVRRKYLGVVLGCAVIWLCQKKPSLSGNGTDIGTMIQSLIFCIDVIIPYLPFDYVQRSLFIFFGDSEGYEFRGSKSRFVTELSYKPCGKKYVKYVQSMNSLIAFVGVALERDVSSGNMSVILKEYTYKTMKKYRNPVGLLPFWIIGYMLYALCDEENNKLTTDKYDIEYFQEMYISMNLDRKKARDFRRMIYGQIKYVERAQNTLDYNSVRRYLLWLRKATI